MTTNEKMETIIYLPQAPNLPGLRFRRYGDDADIEEIVSVEQRCLDADQVDYLLTADEMKRRFEHLNNFDPRRDVLLALINEEIVGYIYMNWSMEVQGARIYRHHGCVLPEWRRQGIGETLLWYAQHHLKTFASEHPEDGPRFYHAWTADTEVGTQAMLQLAGYQPTRYFYEMERTLTEPLLDAPMPPGLTVRFAKPQHYRAIWDALDEAFRDHWGHVPATESHFQWWMKSPTFQPELWRVAWDADQVAGMVLNFIYNEENQRFTRQRGYTEDICVRPPWRRLGLARSLLTQSLQLLKKHGMTVANLGVDTENADGALRLYEGVGFCTIKRYTTYRKPLKQLGLIDRDGTQPIDSI